MLLPNFSDPNYIRRQFDKRFEKPRRKPNRPRYETPLYNLSNDDKCEACKGSGKCRECRGTTWKDEAPDGTKSRCAACNPAMRRGAVRGQCYTCSGSGK